MTGLVKHEKFLFWVFACMLMIPEVYWLISNIDWYWWCDYIVYIAELLLSVQFILLFVKQCPKVLYCIIGGVAIVLNIYTISMILYNNLNWGYDVATEILIKQLFLETSFIPLCNNIVISVLMIILKFKANRACAISTIVMWGINNIWYFGRMIILTAADNYNFIIDASTIIFNWILYRGGATLGYVLLLMVVLKKRCRDCGCIYKKNIKFCGGCGKPIQ